MQVRLDLKSMVPRQQRQKSLLTLLSAPICISQAPGSCSFSLRVFPPRFINPWIDKELPKVFHLI